MHPQPAENERQLERAQALETQDAQLPEGRHHGVDPQLQNELDERRATRNLRNGLISLAVLVALVAGIIFLVPGLHKVTEDMGKMSPGWIGLAVLMEILSCASYVVIFLHVFAEVPRKFGRRVALTEMAFGAVVALAGAGSIAVGAWLLIERGMKPARVAERSAVLFMVTSGVNVGTLSVAGLGTWIGLFHGKRDPLLSLLPGGAAVMVAVLFLLVPVVVDQLLGDREGGRIAAWMRASAGTIRTTARMLITPSWGLVGALGYLWFDIGILWACLHALGHTVPLTSIILSYQIGYLATAIPVPGGVGVLDGSFVGLLVLFGANATRATSAELIYHGIAVWVPALWGTSAYLMLRRSKNQQIDWEERRALVRAEPAAEETPSA